MKALIVVDMQNGFITGSLGTAGARAIVPAVETNSEAPAVFERRNLHRPPGAADAEAHGPYLRQGRRIEGPYSGRKERG